jgi:hypothetical protein
MPAITEDRDLEEIDDSQSSKLLREDNSLFSKQERAIIPFCGCLSVQFYQPYFDVDTNDIKDRLLASLMYCKSEQTFYTMIDDRPDAYGPFWLSTCLVFTLAVCTHISGWLSAWASGKSWEYDFQSILTASSIVYTYVVFTPLVVWALLRQYEKNMKFVSVFCLYGYSLVAFLPAICLCVLPFWEVSWLALLVAGAFSGMFLLKNLAPSIINSARKQAVVLMGIVVIALLIFTIVLKLYFFSYD